MAQLGGVGHTTHSKLCSYCNNNVEPNHVVRVLTLTDGKGVVLEQVLFCENDCNNRLVLVDKDKLLCYPDPRKPDGTIAFIPEKTN